MSTRALIGILNPDGSILAGFQWSDGGNFRSDQASATFHDLKNIEKLVALREWNTMFSPRSKAGKALQKSGSYHITPIGRYNVFTGKDNRDDALKGEAGITYTENGYLVENLKTALATAADYVYVFDAGSSRWRTYH